MLSGRLFILLAGQGHKGEIGSKKKKPDKTTKAVLDGKRVLDLTVARQLAPPAAYLYETTDGRKIRVFDGRRWMFLELSHCHW